ncbi:MAG: urease accessory protein UreF [Azoarcus sp.]|jgi:urease accessory protein|nr:urease accessory protein UreF [Azoarcus sp.]
MLVRLLQLASPALPVGAFSYSQGLERRVEDGGVTDAASAATWIGDALRHAAAAVEAPAVVALLRAWRADDAARAAALNERFVAMRETAEARAETLQMGHSLARLLGELGDMREVAAKLRAAGAEPAFPTVWAAAAAHWGIDETTAAQAWLWSWLENQVMAAVKLVPLGQTAGQNLLFELAAGIPALAADAVARADDDDWRNFTPGLALASARHETQYTRLFRS